MRAAFARGPGAFPTGFFAHRLKVSEGLEHMGRDERCRVILRVCHQHIGIVDRGPGKCCHGVVRALEGGIGLQSE